MRNVWLGVSAALLMLGGCGPRAARNAAPASAPLAANPASPVAPVTAEVTAASEDARLLTQGTDDVPVLMYHDVLPRKDVWFDVTNREFEAQMAELKAAKANVVSLSDIFDHLRTGKPLPPHAIGLTFDDGTMGDYTNAFPVLQRYGYHATFFVHTAFVGKNTVKDHMTWDILREVEKSGLVDVESHTSTHPEDLTIVNNEDLQRELTVSKADLERELGHPCRFFAYPDGKGDERVAQAVRDAGYEAAWNEERAWEASPADRYFLPRFAPFRLDDILDRWSDETKAASAMAGPYPLVGSGSGGAFWPTEKRNGVTWYVTVGRWPAAFPITDLSGGVGGPDRFPCVYNMTRQGFDPIPPDFLFPSYGAPLLVANGSEGVIVPFRPWMGLSETAVQVVLPNANFAALGDEWLVRNGKAVAAEEADERLYDPAFLGATADGQWVAGQVDGRVHRSTLITELLRRKVVNAARLNR